MIDADLTEKNERPLIRNLCSRIKTAESIVKKLERKEREVTFETAVNTLNDIAGVLSLIHIFLQIRICGNRSKRDPGENQ